MNKFLCREKVGKTRKKFLLTGFDEYVSKPIDKELLNEVIDKMLEEKN